MSYPDWMYRHFLGNTLADWASALGWALGATILIALIRRVVSARLARLAERTDTIVDDFFVEGIRSIRKIYVLIIAIGLAMTVGLDFPDAVHDTLKGVTIFVAVLQALRSSNKLAEFWIKHYGARKDSLDRTTLRALSYALRFFVFTAIILIGLEWAGFEVKTLITGLGIGGIAIALALQNILSDLFAALSIVLDKPFVVGDTIAVDNFEGDVVHTGLKSTRIRSINGEEVVFSNADLLRSRLRNLSRRENRRYGIVLQLAPGCPADKIARVPEIIAEAVKSDGRATLQRAHLRAVNATGAEVESSLLIDGTDWAPALDIRQAVLLGVLRGLEREGISLAHANAVMPAATGANS
jgi:small-conductance mechanosensitive channel